MAALKFCEDFRPEYSLFTGGAATGRPSTCWATRPEVAGRHAAGGRAVPYVEAEFMPPEDYDALINNPEGYLLRSYLPRVCSELAGLRQIPSLVTTVEMLGVSMWLGGLAAPPVQQALTKLAQAAEYVGKAMAASMRNSAEMVARYGCPPLVAGVSKAPMDIVADTLRGTRAAALDLYRRPEKLLAASEALVPAAVHMGIGSGQPGRPPFVFMPLHKGAAGFMSFKQFEKFYWPTFKRVMEGIIAAGMVPLPFVVGAFDEPRLELIAHSGLPRGRTLWLFDRSDMPRCASTRRLRGLRRQCSSVAVPCRHTGGDGGALQATDRGDWPGRRLFLASGRRSTKPTRRWCRRSCAARRSTESIEPRCVAAAPRAGRGGRRCVRDADSGRRRGSRSVPCGTRRSS
jgi:hypothetical protein